MPRTADDVETYLLQLDRQFVIDSGVTETYSAMLRYLETHYYTTATRYTTSAFLRVKLGEARDHIETVVGAGYRFVSRPRSG